MTQHEMMNKLTEIIEETKTAVLTTVDSEGRPHVRWMTPAVLRDRQTALFAVTCPDFSKAEHIKSNPKVEWMFQSKSLARIVQVSGVANIIDNPSLKNEALEALAPRLDVFWKANCTSSEFVVLETVIDSATYYEPLSNIREIVKFH
jgi:pyridoxamine 5'-phosphate oxidase